MAQSDPAAGIAAPPVPVRPEQRSVPLSERRLDHLQHHFVLQNQVVVQAALPQEQLLIHRPLGVKRVPIIARMEDQVAQLKIHIQVQAKR